MRKCPNCDSDSINFMDKDFLSVDGKYYCFKCLKCGTFFTRDDMEIGQEVLMEKNE